MSIRSLILASASPRRKKILEQVGYKPDISPTNVSERLNKKLSLDDQVLDVSRQKLVAAIERMTDQHFDKPKVLVTSDTAVILGDEVIGKPSDFDEAFATLKKLSGKTHQVKTAVHVQLLPEGSVYYFVETSDVSFRDIPDDEIKIYIEKFQPFDKAGAYGIQDEDHGFVTHINGSLLNVIGFPLERFEKLLVDQAILVEKHHVVAVSKLQSTGSIENAIAHGHKNFGENYLQEAAEKIPHFQNRKLIWHFIGRLQSNKIFQITEIFDVIHSVDSWKHLKKIDAGAKPVDIFLQINVSGEASKAGLAPEDLMAHAAEYANQLRQARIIGLMTMPPLLTNIESSRVYFAKLRSLRDELQKQVKSCTELSMGTSQDYAIALDEGATYVRLGTLLFGQRKGSHVQDSL